MGGWESILLKAFVGSMRIQSCEEAGKKIRHFIFFFIGMIKS